MSYTKMVKGATKIKMAPPKAKYVDPILHGLRNQKFFNEIVNALQDRLDMNIWTIVYKSLIVIHLMIDTETLALEYFSDNLQFFQLHKIMNSSKWSNNDITALRRYNDYLKGKCYEFGELNEQIERLNSTHRHDKDLIQLQKLFEVESMEREIQLLLKNKYSPQDLQNDLLFYAFKLLIQDLLIKYNKLNEGIISLLESFFDLSYDNAERTLKNYKSFVHLTDYVVKYLKVGKAMGLDIPVIKHITTKLISSLEEHLDNQRNNKNNNNINERKISESTESRKNVSSSSQLNNNSTEQDEINKNAQEHLKRIREQKELLEKQLHQPTSVMITPTLPTNFTGTNPFTPSPVIGNTTDSFSFEQQQPLTATSTSNPFLVQSPVTSTGTGFYATNQNVVPSYTGAGFGGYTQQPQSSPVFPPPQPQQIQTGLLQQQPYQFTGNTVNTTGNNPFALSSIMEEPSLMSSLDPQQQAAAQAAAGITYLPVQVTQYAVVGSNPFEQSQAQAQAQAQQQQSQGQQQGQQQGQRNSNLIDM